jgi:putative ABC transport system permease protein
MKNPLNKRYPRELKQDFGKYAAIFLFLVFFIGAMSGFFVSDISVAATYYEGLEKYNIEDGHMAFNLVPSNELLSKIETENNITLYKMYYKDETVAQNDTTLRIYVDRDTINTECVMDGAMPTASNEMAVDRMYAVNNNISIGDTVTVDGQDYTVTGYSAVPDYSCLFESNADMMFDAVNFGVAFVTNEGYEKIRTTHEKINYAWKYLTPTTDDVDAKNRSDGITDSLEDILKQYDQDLIQAQVDSLYAQAKDISAGLGDDFEKASKTITNKVTAAAEKAAKNAVSSLSSDEILDVISSASGKSRDEIVTSAFNSLGLTDEQKYMLAAYSGALSNEEMLGAALKLSGKTENDLMPTVMSASGMNEDELGTALMKYAAEKQGTTVDGLIAKQLGTTEEKYKAMTEAFEEAKDLTDDLDKTSAEAPKINFDELDNEKDYENDMDFSLDKIYSIVDKISTTGIYDMSGIRATLDHLDALTKTEIDDSEIITIKDYNPKFSNKAINFTIDDTVGDKANAMLMLYMIIAVIAFMFAVTSSNTISKEANVIGTLRASGYTKGELVRHYMMLPIVVTLLGAVVGNIFGYTLFEDMLVGVYYSSYSLPTYETLPSAQAFLDTTVVPLILVVVINLAVIGRKMQLSPLSFLRGELSKGKRKQAVSLSEKLPFISRFRLRILFQNIPSYLTMFIGIFLGGMLAVFGLMYGPLISDYGELVKETQIAQYQYVLVDTVETQNGQAEKYCVTSLDTVSEKYMTDEVMIYGIENGSKYITTEIPSGQVLVSNGYAAKFKLSEGDEITLKDKYSSKTYTFTVGGIYTYDAAISVFMPREDYLSTFGEDSDYFTGYFSNEELTDIDSDDIATVITEKDLTKIVTQMQVSMGEFMNVFKVLGVVIFMLVIYILTKQIIERNAKSISMTKVLGFTNGEIARLYIVITSLVVIGSLLLSIPLIHIALKLIFREYLYTQMTGYIPYIISNTCYVKMFIMGIVSYAVVSIGMFAKIKKLPKGEALKNQSL